MTRCTKFHHLYDEVGNFCGMSPTSMSYYKAYREIVKKLVDLGLEEDLVFENFPEGPGRIISSIKDDETRTKAINYVLACLENKEKVTEGDLKATVKAWRDHELGTCTTSKPSTRSEKLTNVNNEAQTTPEIAKEPQSEKPTESAPVAQTLAEKMKAKDPELDADGFIIISKSAPADPAKVKSARMEELAEELLALYPPTFQTTVTDIIRSHNSPTSKYGVKDAFYYGIMALAEKKP